jgi:hypothetical protein
MSTPETLWVNRHLALLARMHTVGRLHTLWRRDEAGQYCITIEAKGHRATAAFGKDELLSAYRGDDGAQGNVVRALSALIRTLVPIVD